MNNTIKALAFVAFAQLVEANMGSGSGDEKDKDKGMSWEGIGLLFLAAVLITGAVLCCCAKPANNFITTGDYNGCPSDGRENVGGDDNAQALSEVISSQP